MSIAGLLTHFGMKYLFDATSKEVVEWVDSRFTDSSQKPVKVILTANQRAWDVVEAALSDRSFSERVNDTRRDGDLKAARHDIRQLLDEIPPTLGLRAAELRAHAAAELTGLRVKSGPPTEPPGARDSFRRYSDLNALFTEADRAAVEIADTIEPEAPRLAALLPCCAPPQTVAPPCSSRSTGTSFARVLQKTQICRPGSRTTGSASSPNKWTPARSVSSTNSTWCSTSSRA